MLKHDFKTRLIFWLKINRFKKRNDVGLQFTSEHLFVMQWRRNANFFFYFFFLRSNINGSIMHQTAKTCGENRWDKEKKKKNKKKWSNVNWNQFSNYANERQTLWLPELNIKHSSGISSGEMSRCQCLYMRLHLSIMVECSKTIIDYRANGYFISSNVQFCNANDRMVEKERKKPGERLLRFRCIWPVPGQLTLGGPMNNRFSFCRT